MDKIRFHPYVCHVRPFNCSTISCAGSHEIPVLRVRGLYVSLINRKIENTEIQGSRWLIISEDHQGLSWPTMIRFTNLVTCIPTYGIRCISDIRLECISKCQAHSTGRLGKVSLGEDSIENYDVNHYKQGSKVGENAVRWKPWEGIAYDRNVKFDPYGIVGSEPVKRAQRIRSTDAPIIRVF